MQALSQQLQEASERASSLQSAEEQVQALTQQLQEAAGDSAALAEAQGSVADLSGKLAEAVGREQEATAQLQAAQVCTHTGCCWL